MFLVRIRPQAMDGKAEYIIRKLFKAFVDNPSQLPDLVHFSFANFMKLSHQRSEVLAYIGGNKILHHCISNYISSMKDQFAYDEFDRLYGTRILFIADNHIEILQF